MSSKNRDSTEEETYYPVPMTPTDSPQIDYVAIGKELAKDLVIGILIQHLESEEAKSSAKTQIESIAPCSEHVVTVGLKSMLFERSVPKVNKEAVTESFRKHISFLASEIK